MQGEASTRLGFTDYFRVELAWAKLLGLVLLLAPVPARLKSGHTPPSPSPSALRSSPTSRSEKARGGVGLGGGHRACSDSRTLWRRLEGAGERRTARR